jgi:HAD superfamily hydrolase (TIGR01509 family)
LCSPQLLPPALTCGGRTGDAVASSLQAIFWDVDGTLAETELDGHRVAYNQALAEEGLPWRWDRARYLDDLAVAGGRERIECFLTAQEGRPPAGPLLDALVAAKKRLYADLMRSGAIPLREGVARLIGAAAAAGLPQMIVTTSSRAAVEALLAGSLAEVAGAFRGVISGDDVSRKKPDPQGYRLALAAAGLDPQRVVVLEDSIQGLAAASGAGLTTLVTLSSLSRHEGVGAFAAAAAVVDGLGSPERPLALLHGPPCPEGQVTLSWLERLLASA